MKNFSSIQPWSQRPKDGRWIAVIDTQYALADFGNSLVDFVKYVQTEDSGVWECADGDVQVDDSDELSLVWFEIPWVVIKAISDSGPRPWSPDDRVRQLLEDATNG